MFVPIPVESYGGDPVRLGVVCRFHALAVRVPSPPTIITKRRSVGHSEASHIRTHYLRHLPHNTTLGISKG